MVTINQQELDSKIRNLLSKLKRKNSKYKNKILKLETEYKIQKQSIELKAYHSSRFSFLRTGSYYSLNDHISLESLLQLYKNLLSLIGELQQQIDKENLGLKIQYVSYFQDIDGSVYRLTQEDISIEQVTKSSSGDLILKASTIKKIMKYTEETEYLTSHYNNFVGALNATYKGEDKPLPNDVINRGHLAEAFQRHLQLNHGGQISATLGNDGPPFNMGQLWNLIRQSKGNAPGFLQGDVGHYQVKNLTGGNVQLMSSDTMEDLFNFLKYITNPQQDINKQVQAIKKVLIPVGQSDIDKATKIYKEKLIGIATKKQARTIIINLMK